MVQRVSATPVPPLSSPTTLTCTGFVYQPFEPLAAGRRMVVLGGATSRTTGVGRLPSPKKLADAVPKSRRSWYLSASTLDDAVPRSTKSPATVLICASYSTLASAMTFAIRPLDGGSKSWHLENPWIGATKRIVPLTRVNTAVPCTGSGRMVKD